MVTGRWFALFAVVALMGKPSFGFATTPIPGSHPSIPTPAKIEVGDFVFVMLRNDCVAEAGEVLMSRSEYIALNQSRMKTKIALEKELRDGHHSLDSGQARCNFRTLRSSPRIVGDLGQDVVRVRLPEFRLRYHTAFKNEAGLSYPISGLYQKGTSITPLWTVDWFDTDIFLTIDGRYLARVESFIESENDQVVYLYQDGKLFKSYELKYLVEDLDYDNWLRSTWIRSTEFDAATGELRIDTWDGLSHIIDIETGRLFSTKELEAKKYGATVFLLSGESAVLNEIHVCDGRMFHENIQTRGSLAEKYVYGLKSASKNGKAWIEAPMPFYKILQVLRSNEALVDGDIEESTWVLRILSDAIIAAYLIDETDHRFCGHTETGDSVVLSLSQVKEIRFHVDGMYPR